MITGWVSSRVVIDLAKKACNYKGRKRALTPEQAEEARRRAEDGESKAAIARDLGGSRATLYRALSDWNNIEEQGEAEHRWLVALHRGVAVLVVIARGGLAGHLVEPDRVAVLVVVATHSSGADTPVRTRGTTIRPHL